MLPLRRFWNIVIRIVHLGWEAAHVHGPLMLPIVRVGEVNVRYMIQKHNEAISSSQVRKGLRRQVPHGSRIQRPGKHWGRPCGRSKDA